MCEATHLKRVEKVIETKVNNIDTQLIYNGHNKSWQR